MNSGNDISDSRICPLKVKRRYFASELNTPQGYESEEGICDHERNDNQDDGDAYLADDDGSDFNELTAETSSLASSDCSGFVCSEQNIITAVRVRPMLLSEKKSGYRVIVDMSMHPDGLVTKIVNPTALPPPCRGQASERYTPRNLPLIESTPTNSTVFPAQFTQEFKFDCSFWSAGKLSSHQGDTQNSIYNELGMLAVQTVLQGHNCSVFAYGQAGAGKTYTMMGGGGRTSLEAYETTNDNSSGVTMPNPLTASGQRGLIPRICQGIFAEIDEVKRSGNTCTIVMSYVEIYDERVYDLLSQATIKKPLKVREHPENGAFVERAKREHVTSYRQVLELIEEGNRTRSVTSTHNSTRSHTVLILSLTQRASRSLEMPRSSKICMVDLAGSERVDHGATGARLREAVSVNRSLTTLADVVGALAKRKNNRFTDSPQHNKAFVPYRNSVLTRLLKECLGGRAKTILIGVISPCCAHYEDSIATLRYIERAKNVNSAIRFQADTSEDMAHKFLGDGNALKSNLCVSNETSIPPAMLEVPETNDKRLNCALLNLRSRSYSDSTTGSNLLITCRDANVEEIRNTVLDVRFDRNGGFLVEMPNGFPYERTVEKALRETLILLKLVGIRRRSLTLHQYRAFDRWRKLVYLDGTTSKEQLVTLEMDNEMCDRTDPPPLIGRRAGNPPQHMRARPTETQSVGRVHEVVETVVTTDAICCSVVQDFLFPHQQDSPNLSTKQSNNAASASLLELLASSSEFDRSGYPNEYCGNNEPQLEELALSEDCKLNSATELDTIGRTDALDNRGALPLLSPARRDEKNPVHSALSLCVDSIDSARRALGPSLCKLHFRSTGSGTGVECELLRYLDKRFLMITRILEDLIVAPQLHDDNLWGVLSRSTCEILESIVGEFCLQIIAKLCDQLPSASSACVAGRLQLETQLDHFSDRLKRKLLPEIARSDDNPEITNNVAFFVVTELLVMAERIKLVWNLAGYQKRERLLQAQALEATVVKDRKMVAKIAALEERNAELSARYDALLATSAVLDEPNMEKLDVDYCERSNRIQSDITLEELGKRHDGDVAPSHNDAIEAKLAEEVARTREVQARNDTLLCQIASLNHTLTSCSARMTELEAENTRLNSELHIANKNDMISGNCVNSMEAPVDKLQKELENRSKVQELESQLIEFKRINLEQTTALENARALFSREEETRKKADACVVLLRRQIDQSESENLLQTAAIEHLEMSLSKAQTQREVAGMLAEDLASKQNLRTDQIFVLEMQISKDEQRLLELESSLITAVQERDENILLHSQTEDALVSALDRENVLQDQLNGVSNRELEALNCVRNQLHEATLELASLREELAELLDHSTLQSATIETLKFEQSESIRHAQELEVERDQLLLRYQVEQDDSEQKERTYQEMAQQYAEKLSKLEKQQETERQECMAVNEALQRQTNAFQELQTQQHSIKMDYCSTIRDLKTQIETRSAKTRALDEELAASTIALDAVRTAAAAQIQELEDQLKLSVSSHEEIAHNTAEHVQECNESPRSRYDTIGVSTQATSSMELTVNEHLNSLDAWFDEVISGNQETTEISTSVSMVSENTEDSGARSSLLKTLTDLGALTNELLVVYEGTPDHSNNSPTEGIDQVHHDTSGKGGSELNSKDPHKEILNVDVNVETRKMMEQQPEKASDEVVQLRKIVMKLKEALEVKDDMLLFLDGKVRRLEQGT